MNQLVRETKKDGTVNEYKYDGLGNRIEDGKLPIDAADQLVSVKKKGESAPFAEYRYDDDGRRIQKKVNGIITNYIYDGDSLNVLYETMPKTWLETIKKEVE